MIVPSACDAKNNVAEDGTQCTAVQEEFVMQPFNCLISIRLHIFASDSIYYLFIQPHIPRRYGIFLLVNICLVVKNFYPHTVPDQVSSIEAYDNIKMIRGRAKLVNIMACRKSRESYAR